MKTEKDRRFWFERWGGWILICVFVLIPIAWWFVIQPFDERFDTSSSSSILLSFGRLAGLAGFMLYALNLVLSIRRHWLENLFGGLNKVYTAHHLTGGIALILLLFHPFFFALSYIELSVWATIKDAATFLMPRAFDFNGDIYQLQDAAAVNSGIVAFLGMVVLLFIAFFVKLPYRIWVFIHKFLGVAFVFAGLHMVLIVSDVYNDNFLRYYYIAWTIIGLSAFVYRSLLGNIFIRRMPYRVINTGLMSGGVLQISLEPLAKQLNFKPGQFVFVRFLSAGRGIKKEPHPFSIASIPGEPNQQVRFYIKALGDFTDSLKSLEMGTIAEIEGAFGRFIPARYANTPQIWIAGGIGITPFLSIARSFDATKPPVDMFYSVQTRAELLDQKALAEYLPMYYPQFKYHSFVNEEQEGYMSAHYINEQAG
ncbi:MAG: ferric reductase-like transmembrane domain-containing protein, partial [Candidatus Saccharibacteria bacterium]